MKLTKTQTKQVEALMKAWRMADINTIDKVMARFERLADGIAKSNKVEVEVAVQYLRDLKG